MTKLILLDAGHGVNTAGKRSPNGDREWTLNDAVAKRVAAGLAMYQDVETMRLDDTTGKEDIALATRVAKANQTNAICLVSLHHNALNGTWGSHGGVETYHHTGGSAADKQLANLIQPKLASKTGLKNRGVKSEKWHILTVKASIDAVLVEGGFYDSTIDYPVLTSIAGQQAYADAVVEGLVEMYHLVKKEAQPSAPAPDSKRMWRVCLGSFSNYDYAKALVAKAKEDGYDSFLVPYDIE